MQRPYDGLTGALSMKNVYEVLRQKEMELTRLEKEVEALRLVAPLLSEGMEINSDAAKATLPTAVNGPQQPIRIPAAPVVAAAQAGAGCRLGRYCPSAGRKAALACSPAILSARFFYSVRVRAPYQPGTTSRADVFLQPSARLFTLPKFLLALPAGDLPLWAVL